MDVVREDGFFQPTQIERFDQRQHALGVIEVPAHVGIGHDVDAITQGFTERAEQVEIFLHTGGAVGGPPSEAHLHGLVAFIFIFGGFGAEFVERCGV